MSNFAICDHGLIEANFVPEQCLGAPGSCPPGIYHTFFRHDGFVGLLELRLRYFAEQLRAFDHNPENFTKSLFNADLLAELLAKENLTDVPTRVRMMVFDEPIILENKMTTQAVAFAKAAQSMADTSKPFRCAVAGRRRLDTVQPWEVKRLGRLQIDQDLEEAKSRGFDDVLYLDRMGHWCEASYANIVAVYGNRVCVLGPPGLAYPGLTAGILSVMNKELKPLQIHSANIEMREIAQADEVFLTSAVRGLQPVTEIEGIGSWPLDQADSVRNRIWNQMKESGAI